eukprot:1325402-Pleurochrysis_carterae.AAC.1
MGMHLTLDDLKSCTSLKMLQCVAGISDLICLQRVHNGSTVESRRNGVHHRFIRGLMCSDSP